jgi:hypothetical protein
MRSCYTGIDGEEFVSVVVYIMMLSLSLDTVNMILASGRNIYKISWSIMIGREFYNSRGIKSSFLSHTS